MGDHERMKQIGFLVGVLSGVILAALLIMLMKKDRTWKCKYDERQLLVQGRAFKYGFFGWMFFDVFCIIADVGLEVTWMDRPMLLLCGILVGITIYASYSIWHDGYFSMNEKPRRILAILAAAALLNIACAARQAFVHHGLLENGVLSFFYSSNLFVAAVSVFLLSVVAIKSILEHRKPE